jgi:hypothetical protein
MQNAKCKMQNKGRKKQGRECLVRIYHFAFIILHFAFPSDFPLAMTGRDGLRFETFGRG